MASAKADRSLAEIMHARLIRMQTDILNVSGYWYVGDKSPSLEKNKDLEQI